MAQEIGSAKAIQGQVTAVGPEGSRTLSIGSPVFKGDTLATAKGSAGSIQFLDKTVLNVGEGSKVSLDQYVYDSSKGSGQALFKMAQGTFRAVTGEIVKQNPESFKMQSPLATIGIRGTETAHTVPAPDQPNASESHLVMVFDGKPVIVQPLGGGAFQVLSQAGVKVEVGKFGAGPVMVMTPQEFKYFQALTTTGVQQGVTRDTISPQGQQTKDPKVQGAQDAATKATADAQAKAADAAAAKAAAEAAAKAAAEAAASGDPAAKAAADAAAKAAADAAAKAALDAKAAAELAAKAQAEAFAAQQAMAMAEAAKAAADAAAKAALDSGNQGNSLTLNPGSIITFTTTTNSSGQTTTTITVTQSGGGSQGATGGVIVSDQAGSTTVIDTTHDNQNNNGNNGTDNQTTTTLDLSGSQHAMEVDLNSHYTFDLVSHQSASIASTIVNVVGSGYSDEIIGNSGANNLQGGDGNDTIIGGGGVDSLYGGAGDDVIVGGPQAVLVDAGTGADTVTTGAGSDAIFMGTALNNADGQDTIDAGSGHDVLYFTDNGHDTHDLDTTRGVEEIILGDAATNITFPGPDTFGSTDWGDIGGVLTVDGHALAADHSMVFDGSAAVDGAFSIIGGAGNDILTGGHGNDTIAGGAGNDLLTGNNGNDFLVGGAGNDTIIGGNGNDTASYASSTSGVIVSLTTGLAASDGLGGHDTLSGIENIIGSNQADSIQGDSGNNVIEGCKGADSLYGGGGNDVFVFREGDIDAAKSLTATSADTVRAYGDIDFRDAGAGFGGFGAVELMTSGDTVSFSRPQLTELTAITLHGDGGTAAQTMAVYLDTTNTVVDSTTSNITGALAGDVFAFHGSTAADNITGTGWNDSIEGGDGADTLTGGLGNDTIAGGSGADSITGGDGDDLLTGGAGNDTIIGGSGNDTASYASSTSGITVSMSDGMASDGLGGTDTLSGVENITGSSYADSITGNAGANVLIGGGGADTLTGGAGADTVTGGAGADTFVFNAGDLAAGDTITDATSADILEAHGTIDFRAATGVGGFGTLTLVGDGNTVSFTKGQLSGLGTINFQHSSSGPDKLAVYLDSTHHNVDASGAVIAGNIASDGFEFHGTPDTDSITGSSINDSIIGSQGYDTIHGGAGTDILSYASIQGLVGVSYIWTDTSTGSGHVTLTGDGLTVGEQYFTGIEHVDGATGGTLHYQGGAGDVAITGTDGNDIFDFGANLTSGDTIDGGLGHNTLIFTQQNGSHTGDLTNVSNVDLITLGNASTSLTITNAMATALQGSQSYISIDGSGVGHPNSLVVNASAVTNPSDALHISAGTGEFTLIGGAGDDAFLLGESNTGHVQAASVINGGDGANELRIDADMDLRGVAITNIQAAESNNAHVIMDSSQFDASGDMSDACDIDLKGGSILEIKAGATATDYSNLNVLLESSTLKIDAHSGGGLLDLSTLSHVGVDNANNTSNHVEIIGSDADDTFNLSGLASLSSHLTIDGGDGTNTITFAGASAGVDLDLSPGDISNIQVVIGSAHADSITGSSDFATVIEGGAGADTLTGGGQDTLSYEHSTGSVVAQLDQATAQDGFGATDDISGGGFVNLVGSAHADSLGGDANDNLIEAGAGNDTIMASEGDDTIHGGAGTDTLSYFNLSNAHQLTIDMTAQTMHDALGGGSGQSFSGIEIVSGGAGNDSITGSSGSETVMGTEGQDTLHGGAGTDTLDYSWMVSDLPLNINIATGTALVDGLTQHFDGFEHIIGGQDEDIITGNANIASVIEGGQDIDHLTGGGLDTLSYEHDEGSVTVNLEQLTAHDGSGATDDIGGGFINLVGSAYADFLIGDVQDNIIEGLAGNDTLKGGMDTMPGADGLDTVSYEHAGAGVTVDLGAGTATGGAGNDTLAGFENILGSQYADSLTGDASDNVIEGLGGNDTLKGGMDTMPGADGLDTVSYEHAGAGVTVNLATGTATGGAGNDTISGFENILGSQYADSLTGDASDNVIEGGAGNDTLSFAHASEAVTVTLANEGTGAVTTASTGTDTYDGFENLMGTAYDDALTGNSGNNVLHGLAGDDTLIGTAGNDYLYGDGGINTVDYHNLATGVSVTLNDNHNDEGYFEGSADHGIYTDQLLGIYNVIGTSHADTITGNSADNVVEGLGVSTSTGSDHDSLDGGGGNDTLSYANLGAGVTLSMPLGTTTYTLGGAIHTDQFSNFETIIGSAYADLLEGDTAINAIYAGAGDDLIHASQGSDSIYGGAGTDTLDFSSFTDALKVTFGFTSLEQAGQVLFGGSTTQAFSSIEHVIGGTGNDTFYGGFGDEVVEGGGGNNCLIGYDGHDTVSYEHLANTTNVGVLLDLSDNSHSQTLDGVPYDCAISTFTSGSDAPTHDYLAHTSEYPWVNIIGSQYNDTLTGDSHDNVIKGLGGDDTLHGGDGNDSLDGGTGHNTLFGDAGDDLLTSGGWGSALDGGADTDTVSYADYNDTVTVNLASGYAHLGWTGSSFLATDTLSAIENIVGSSHNDYLFGDAGANAIQGGQGNDTICGGNTGMSGGAEDTLTGGAGADVFHFRTTGGSTVITDFEHGTDKISLYTGGGFAALSGTWSFNTVNSGGHSGSDGNAALTYDTGDHTLYYDADGTGTGAAVAVASFSNHATVTQSDIVVTAADHTGH